MTEVKIYKHTATNDDKDYDFLRNEGVEYIKQMAGNVWTDHNLHDPGITFLEVLCYAITDLGYRISAPIQDLLAEENNTQSLLEKTFPTAKNILTTKPITENDYRKLFIDIPDVKNAFIKPYLDSTVHMHCSTLDEVTDDNPKGRLSYDNEIEDYEHHNRFTLKGLNKVFFVPDTSIAQMEDGPEKEEAINLLTDAITTAYHANRNLCEDLVEVCVAEEYEINVCGDIEIEKTAEAKEVVAEILFNIQEFLSPSLKRYTLQQLLDQGQRPEEIFNGPILENGFITDEELENSNFKTELRLSDLIQIISETEGVKRIKKILMKPCACNQEEDDEPCPNLDNPWKICLPSDFTKIIKLCLDNSIINVFKDIIPIDLDQDEVKALAIEKMNEFNVSNSLPYEDFPIPSGNFLNSGIYHSIQNDLPNVYGVDEIGLSPQLPEERHAKVLQLKGYLSFFDQILATYFSHLEHVGELLSLDVSGANTYYGNDLTDIKNFKEKIVKDTSSFESQTLQYLDELDDYVDRKGIFLDHLLARFAENMNDYVFLMIDLFGVESKGASLFHKSKMLEEYEDLGYKRGCAFNYFGKEHGVWDTYNVSGLQHRLARLLGFRDYSRRDLTSFNFEFFQKVDEEDVVHHGWRIKNADDQVIFTSSKLFPSVIEAEDDMWKTIALAWDENNYDLQIDGDDKWYFSLVDKSKEVVALHDELYDDKESAEQAIENYAKYIYDHVTDEGMYLFENILLRPDESDPNATEKFMEICVNDDCEQCKPNDPYSFRLTIVLPGWTKRFRNIYFREFAERVIREEVPAHILTRICWIGYPTEDDSGAPSQMQELEKLYHEWLQKKMESPQDQSGNDKLKPLVDLLHELDTIYPTGTLHDCKDDASGTSPIILNQSSLGDINIEQDGNT